MVQSGATLAQETPPGRVDSRPSAGSGQAFRGNDVANLPGRARNAFCTAGRLPSGARGA